MVGDISHEGLRTALREEGVTFQRIKTWKASTGQLIRRYIIWRNNHAYNERLRRVVTRANAA